MVQPLDDARRRRRTDGDGSRVPPHNLQAEESLLGAMLLSRDAIVAAVEVQLGPDDFYKPAHGHIFEAITGLYARGEPADPVTVADELRRAGLAEVVGGPSLLVSLQANTPAIGNAGRYARIVEEHALLRRLIGVAGAIAEMGYSVPEDVAAAIDSAEALVFDVAQRRVTDSLASIRDLLERHLDHIEALYERGQDITGVPTGYLDLDQQLAGLQPANLVIVGGRPGTGKTSFALGIAAHAALESRTPVLLMSLEMSHLELTQRMLCSEARVDATRMRNGRLLESDWPKISHAVGRLAEAPIYIDDNPHLTVMEIRAKARRLKSRSGLGLIIVDYLQLMTGRPNAESRQVEVSEISRGLKILARELEVPVVALSQLSRGLESRADKRPVLADLRESGCMPASTRLSLADGTETTLGALVLSQAQPLVWSLDERRGLVPKGLLRVFPCGVRPVFRLRLASGYEVDATANHPFRAVDRWAPLGDLEAGGLIAVPARLPPPVEPAPPWDDDEVILLAHLLGSGSAGPAGVKYAATDPANKDIVEQAAERLFGIDVAGSKAGKVWTLSLPSPYGLTHGRRHPVRNWLEPLGLWGSRSHDRFIPEELFRLGNEQIALFLRHLWAASGSITPGRKRGNAVTVDYTTTSGRLASGLRRLLLRLNIRSEVHQGHKASHRECLNVRVAPGPDVARFLQVIGGHGRCHELDLLVAGTESRSPRPARDRLQPTSGILDIPACASDLFWDEIESITPLGEQPTFDATVDGTHNFVANGIIAHNSLEQDSDVVIFLYRDEVYNRDSPDRGTAEVIVAKHRNGPTGVTQLAFLDHYTRFANMAKGV